MNWIAQAFQELKAKVESHIPHVNRSLTELDSRVSGAEAYVKGAVESTAAKLSTLESVTVQGLENRVKALELRASHPLSGIVP